MKKTIVIDLRTLDWTGIGRLAKNLLIITRSINKFDFIYIINKKHEHYLEISDKRIIFISKIFSLFEQIEYQNLYRYTKEKYQLHLTQFNTPLIKPYRCEKIYINIYDLLEGTGEFRTFIHKFFYYLYIKIIILNSYFLIAQSCFTYNQIIKKWNINKHIFIIQPPFERKERLISSNESHEYLLYVGLNKPRKNLIGLLNAYEEIIKNPGNILNIPKLKIVGPVKGELSYGFDIDFKINNSVHLKSYVDILGFVSDDDLDKLYTEANLLVIPSTLESGFSYPALESLQRGTPVLLNKYDMSEFESDGVYFFNNLTENNLETSLRNLLFNRPPRVDNNKLLNQLCFNNYSKKLEYIYNI